mgnify:CR=1 FL=1
MILHNLFKIENKKNTTKVMHNTPPTQNMENHRTMSKKLFTIND